jgi:hypothetical protein
MMSIKHTNQGIYVACTDWTTSNKDLLQTAVEDFIVLEYIKQCDDGGKTHSSKDLLIYQADSKTRESECSNHNKAFTYDEYMVEIHTCNDLVLVPKTDQVVSQCSGGTIHM